MNQKEKSERSCIGSRAYDLKKLQENGFYIPDFFVIDTKDFREYIQKIEKQILEYLSQTNYDNEEEVELCSYRIMKLIDGVVDQEVTKKIEQEIMAHFTDTTTFSIRLSGINEELEELGFSSQFKTYLHVLRKDIMTYVKKSWKSLYLPNLLIYYKKNNSNLKELNIAVMVQKTISTSISGITFTNNPQGLLNEMVVMVGIGVGENTVLDQVGITTYYYNKTDKLSYYETQRNSPILEEANFFNLVACCQKIEWLFQQELDIEWAMQNERIYILQIRKSIVAEKKTETIRLTSQKIEEKYPGITLPLTSSFIEAVYGKIVRKAAKRIIKNEDFINSHEKIFCHMVECLNGRVYYCLNNWYTVIHWLPISKKIMSIWQEYLGLSEKNIDKNVREKREISISQKSKISKNISTLLKKNLKNMNALNEKFLKTLELYQATYHDGLDNATLVKLYEILEEGIISEWDLTLINELYTGMYIYLLKKDLHTLSIYHSEEMVKQYILCIADIENLVPLRELISIASLVDEKRQKELQDLTSKQKIEEYLMSKNDFFIEKLKQYMKLYVDSGLGKIKLENMEVRQNSQKLIEKILEYSKEKERLNEIKNCINRTYDPHIDRKVLKRALPWKRMRIQTHAKRVKYGIQNKEISALNQRRIEKMIRDIFLSIGNNFYQSKLIQKREDIFYLKKEEVFQYIKDKRIIDFKGIIDERKRKYNIFYQLPAYSNFVFLEKTFSKSHQNIHCISVEKKDTHFVGIPCFNGMTEGEVVVLRENQEGEKLENRILVVNRTDSLSEILIMKAKGVILQDSNVFSYFASILREFRIPSIIGVKNAAEVLKTGDRISLNGNTGEIEIIERSN